jgi:hypothetical protein
VFYSNSDLAPGSVYLALYLQFNPCNFETIYPFNCNSVLSDFYAKSFIGTKPI